MANESVVRGLRKVARRLRKQAQREGKRTMRKTAALKLDPQKVLDFMLFYGR